MVLSDFFIFFTFLRSLLQAGMKAGSGHGFINGFTCPSNNLIQGYETGIFLGSH